MKGTIMSYLELQNVTKIIHGNTVLDNVSLRIEQGEIVGFVGKNGSGKTMLFRAFCGLIRPTQGEVLYEGKAIGKQLNFLPDAGLLIENVGLWDHLTALENLKLLNSIGENKRSVEQLKEVIRKFGLDPDSKKTFKKFSLGMKQRLCLAQAFMENPKTLILDEPTNALDKAGVEEVEGFILEQREKGSTVLLASHDEACVKRVCDRVLYMYEGKLSAEEI